MKYFILRLTKENQNNIKIIHVKKEMIAVSGKKQLAVKDHHFIIQVLNYIKTAKIKENDMLILGIPVRVAPAGILHLDFLNILREKRKKGYNCPFLMIKKLRFTMLTNYIVICFNNILLCKTTNNSIHKNC